jgi:hypothetical protein
MSAALAVVEAAARAETWDPNGDRSISEYAEVAAYFGLPLWAMLVPGLTRDMFEDISKMMRLVVKGILRNLKFAAEVRPKLLAGLNEDERAIVEAGWLDGSGLGPDRFNRSAFEGTRVRR